MTKQPAVCLLLALSLAACPTPANPDPSPTVVASGMGEVMVPPTRARAVITTTTKARTAASAGHDNSTRLESLLTALRAQRGLDSIRVTYVSVDPNEDDSGRMVGYEATAGVEFRILQLDSVGPALDLALQAGATSINRVTFEADSAPQARVQALGQAFERAQADAEALAQASGHRLGALVALSTDNGYGISVSSNAFEDAAVSTLASSARFGGARSGLVGLGPTPRAIRITASASGKWLLVKPPL